MKTIVVGAGATLAEAIAAGTPEKNRPPVMSNFAQKTWREFNPHPYLDRYLETLGITTVNEDGREEFFKLEKSLDKNVEQFFEFCWKNRKKSWSWSDNPKVQKSGMVMDMKDKNGNSFEGLGVPKDFIKGSSITSAGPSSVSISNRDLDFWENLIQFGITQPLITSLISWAHKQGVGNIPFKVSHSILKYINPGDLIINLNYDTIIEIALKQLGVRFNYCPSYTTALINVAKPHGSLNLSYFPSQRTFQINPDPEWWGSPQPPGGISPYGIVPPRTDKSYEQHPYAKAVINDIKNVYTSELIFWGVGLTESDVDLLDSFKQLASTSLSVEVINPDPSVNEKIKQLLNCDTNYFYSLGEWINKRN